ncbi:hypothetical protein BZG35_05580 [Brevundimonas sp. LM2]|uniref:cell wall hydrolase n=1 Tax=Brevundimonas sp. LM2 TaxID=1938605 RepID=UPI000983B985|nr:cell wall hydrolase [Brevundimonas sp. LM2]AQR61180.1 hypothetical protein BZG35_05580 [Brevundimonas sp. LM2]
MPNSADQIPGANRHRLLLIGALGTVVVAAGGWLAWRQFDVPPAPTRPSAPVPRAPDQAAMERDSEAITPFDLRALSFEEALAYNRGIPVSTLPNPAARPFVMGTADTLDVNNAADCLTAALYYEARTEPVDGQRAVAQVVLNRLRHPAYPKTVCGVVFQGAERYSGCQFSFTCDGALAMMPDPVVWDRLRAIAVKSLEGDVYAPVGMATHYHAGYVVPYWADSLVKVREIGLHIFYRWTGGWGTPAAFTGQRSGVEILPLLLQPYSKTYLDALAAAEAEGLAAAAAAAAAAVPAPTVVVADITETPPAARASEPRRDGVDQPASTSAPSETAPQASPPARPASEWFGSTRRNAQRLPVPGN